jgi:hypothetical protein
MQKLFALSVLAAGLALAACGNTPLERGATGAAIGAVGATAVGGNAVVGAVGGGAVGLATCNKNIYGKCK